MNIVRDRKAIRGQSPNSPPISQVDRPLVTLTSFRRGARVKRGMRAEVVAEREVGKASRRVVIS